MDELPAAFRLTNGREVEFGLVTPEAAPLIQAAMGRLSEETSRRRFFTVRHQLSEHELARLTELDGWDRFAIGATGRLPDGSVEGAAVARFDRLADAPDTAEFALVVVDDYQRAGIGQRLLGALAQAARRRGIRRLCGQVLADNDDMLRFLARHAPGPLQVGRSEDGTVTVELLVDAPSSDGGSASGRVKFVNPVEERFA